MVFSPRNSPKNLTFSLALILLCFVGYYIKITDIIYLIIIKSVGLTGVVRNRYEPADGFPRGSVVRIRKKRTVGMVAGICREIKWTYLIFSKIKPLREHGHGLHHR
jgi:hypothetical protein